MTEHIKKRENPRTVHLVRHGVTSWNDEGRIQGRGKDVPLSDKGRGQVNDLLPLLDRVSVNRVITSPLSRAKETADMIALHMGVPISVYEGLAERSLGDYEGQKAEDVQKLYPSSVFWHEQTPPNGESLEEFRERAIGTINLVLDDHPDEDLLVICHGWIIRELNTYFTGTSTVTTDGYDIKNATLYSYEVSR